MSAPGRLAFGVALGLAAIFGGPVRAQMMDSRLTLNGVTLSMSWDEQTRLLELGRTIRGNNRGAQERALAAAVTIANTPDARYALAVYRLELGRQRQDDALRIQGLDVLIASDMTPAERLPAFLASRGAIAFRRQDYETASRTWGRLLALQPNDAQALFNMAQLRNAQADAAGAMALIQRAIAARRAGPDPVPEGWYRQWVSIAFNGGQAGPGTAAALALVAAFPTPENWRFALLAYRQLVAPQAAAEIDLLQLMRAAGALVRPEEYLRLAQLLKQAGLATEARAVLDDGLSRAVLDRTRSPTPEIIAEVDRAVSRQPAGIETPQRDTGDRAATSVHLGMAHMLAGRRGEAEIAFRAASGEAGSVYPELAKFWLAWLAVRR